MKKSGYLLVAIVLAAAIILPGNGACGANLVGHWAFDEGQGRVAHDSSPYGNAGTIYNATWVGGKSGSALSYDGATAYVQVPNSAQYNMTGAVSVEAWVLMTPWQSSDQPDVFDKSHRGPDDPPYYSGYAIQGSLQTRQALGFVACNGSSCSEPHSLVALNDSAWHFLAGTASVGEGVIRFYLDGQMTEEQVFDAPLGANEGDVFIGRHYLRGRYFSGVIDEVKVYEGALAPQDVWSHYIEYVPVEIIFSNTPNTASRGQVSSWDYRLTNNTDLSQTFDWWLTISGPGSRNLYLGEKTLAPHATDSGTLRLRVPRRAPLGLYTVCGIVGDWSALSGWDQDCFPCEVVGSPDNVFGEDFSDWRVEVK